MRRVTYAPRRCAGCGESFVPPKGHREQRNCSLACGRKRGAENNRYNGGICIRQDGRAVICCRDGSQVAFYRAVLAAELGRLLTEDEIVHHRNGDPSDDRLENLQIVTRAEHMRMHYHDINGAR